MSAIDVTALLAQTTSSEPGAGVLLLIFLPLIGFVILMIAAQWKIYEKAGQPGWGCIIPFYAQYLQTQIAGRPGWWTVLLLLPYISMIFYLIVWWDIVQAFGRKAGTYLGVIFLPFIFIPILGFGSAQYRETSMGELGSVFE